MAFFGSTAHGIFLNLPSLIISAALIKNAQLSSSFYFDGYVYFVKNIFLVRKVNKQRKLLEENLAEVERLEAEIAEVVKKQDLTIQLNSILEK